MTKYASNKKRRFWGRRSMEDFGVLWVWGFPWGFPRDFAVCMGWVWGLKSNPHGSPGSMSMPSTAHFLLPVWHILLLTVNTEGGQKCVITWQSRATLNCM